MLLGWREWVSLPQLGLPALKAKIDTGAKTSALHAFSIETFGPADAPRVRFGVHPVDYNSDVEVWCTAKVADRRYVRSSNGQSEHRYIINTPIRIARAGMAYRGIAFEPAYHGAPDAARPQRA